MTALDRKTLQRYRSDPVAFINEVLRDPETGKPYTLFPAELEFLKHALNTRPDGRLLYSQLLYCCPKKSGKTVFGALFMIMVLILFGERYAEGYAAANDLEQAQGRVFEICKRIIEASPLLRRAAKVTADRITFPATGATITALASDYASAAGGHPTISVFDELWGYTSERSRRLWDELIPVPTRKISCRLIVSHAGFSGESVLLEELQKRGLAQPKVGPDLYAGDGMLMFWTHEPVSPRQDAQWLIDMRRDLRPHQYVRMVENRFTSGDASFIDLAKWDACVDPEARPLVADKELPFVVGIDAAVKHDSTAIVVCAWDEDAKRVRLVWHRVFQPTPTQHLDFEGTIESTLLDLRQRFLVKRVLYDPYQMAATSQRLTRAGLRIEEFQQSLPNLTKASQNLFELINGRNIVLYPDAAMRLAISHAVAKESARGWLITKEKQSHKIDVVVALGMAALAAVQSATIVPEHVPMVPPLIYSPLSGWSDEGARPQSAHAAWARQYYGGSDRFAAIGGRTSPIVPGSRRREW